MFVAYFKNAPSRFRDLNSKSKFIYFFNKCQKYCDLELEFQHTWDQMTQKFDIENQCWLNMMYKV